jgi:hypothetical protein
MDPTPMVPIPEAHSAAPAVAHAAMVMAPLKL